MEREEQQLWREHLPALDDWLGNEPTALPSRATCLSTVEDRAALLTVPEVEGFVALATNWSLPRLPDDHLELVIRILLQARAGRCSALHLGEFGKRLLANADRRARLGVQYASDLRTWVAEEEQ